MTSEFQNIDKIISRLQKRSELLTLANNFSCCEPGFVCEKEVGNPSDCRHPMVYVCTATFGGGCTPKNDGNFHCDSDKGHACSSEFGSGAFTCKPDNIKKGPSFDSSAVSFTTCFCRLERFMACVAEWRNDFFSNNPMQQKPTTCKE